MMGESLHHFRDIDEALGETVRVLKNGGKLFIYDFDVASFKGKSICKMEKMLGEPGNFFDILGIQEKLEDYGFIVRVESHGWRYTVVATLA
jgi:demethylmenaquinone methyltransferase/2-methoxy-6-polyprenyl-1,4-benzoquinol methylase